MIKSRQIFVMLFFLILPAFALAATVQLPKTGQTKCYDENGNQIDCNGTGLDGEIQAGVAWPSPRFVDNGDGTITDMLTGLMWLKDWDCLGIFNTWQGALDAIVDFNSDPSSYNCADYTATYSDWRLPNVRELASLINYSLDWQSGWYLLSQGFKDIYNAPGTVYWTSTTYAPDTSYAWGVDFLATNGGVYAATKTSHMPVTAVRAGPKDDPDQAYPANLLKTGQTISYDANNPPRDDGALQWGVSWPDPRFVKGSIKDNATGKTYINVSKCIIEHYKDEDKDGVLGDGKVYFGTALELIKKYKSNIYEDCESIPEGYQCNMPNIKELESLVDRSLDFPFVLFQNDNWPTDAPYWTSTGANLWPLEYQVISLDGGETAEQRDETNYVVMVCEQSGPRIKVAPSSVDFGRVVVNKSENEVITIINEGEENLVVKDIKITGDVGFCLTDTFCEKTILPNESCDFWIDYKSISPGNKTATLIINSNDPTSPTRIPLTVTGISPTSGENNDNNGETDDPVSTATGEIYFSTVDLDLGGPLPLFFGRYYASYLQLNGKLGDFDSPLGTNWMHNFELRLDKTDTEIKVIYYKGKTIDFTLDNGTWKLKDKEPLAYQLIASGSDYKFMDPSRDLIFTFDGDGKLIRIEDRNGNALTLTYSGNQLAQVSDGLGRSLSFTYDAGSRLIEVRDQTGRKISFGHGGIGGIYLTSYTDPSGHTTTYSYTQKTGISGLLTSVTRPRGNTPYTQTYDDAGRVTSQADSTGAATTVAHESPEQGKTTVTDPAGNSFVHTHEKYANLTSHKDQTGNSVAIGYDENDRRTSVTDRMGDTTSITYHAESGKVASYTNAEGHTTTYSYEAHVQDGFTFYDLTQIDYPDGTSEQFSYDGKGNISQRTDRAGKVWQYTYNARGQVLSATNPLGGQTQFTYNPDATLASVQDALGHTTTYDYDGKKRLSKITYPDGTYRSFTYDDNDNLLSVQDERGNVTHYAYDENNNLKSIQDALGNTVAFGYDGNDRLISVTDKLGKIYAYAYNPLGRLAQVTNPLGESTTFGYDAHGWLTSITDPAARPCRRAMTRRE